MKNLFCLIFPLMMLSCATAPAFTKSEPKPPVDEPVTQLPTVVVTPSPTPAPTPITTPKPAAGQPTAADVRAKITGIASAATGCSSYNFKDRGRAPAGYMKGMSMVYAKQYCNQFREDVLAVRKPTTANTNDVLNTYASLIKTAGLAGDPTLRQVYTFLIGLGMSETSGRYCCGRDASMDFTAADTAEAGLMQTSYNATAFSPTLKTIWARYEKSDAGCYLDVFKEGVSSTYCAGQTKNWGDSKAVGYQFQIRQKACPALAVEFAALLVRFSGSPTKSHYGPIRKKSAQVVPACGAMLASVEKYIDANPTACNSL